MNPFNKYEAIGIFLSVVVMAIALSVIRFNTNIFAVNNGNDGAAQSAMIAVSQTDKADNDSQVRQALIDASTAKGKLEKLVIDDVRLGSGAAVKKGDTVTVNYEGKTQDGVKFDSSYERGQPFEFSVGAGKVIAGWDTGLVGMKVGGQRILVIPSDMAYGNRQVGPIPANSPLVFSIELISIK